MSPRIPRLLLLATAIALTGVGCRSSSRSFYMDSNSRLPWFGLNLSLPKSSSSRKTLETIADSAPESHAVQTAELREVEPESKPVRSRLPRWLGGTETSLPLPSDAPRIDAEETIELTGPRQEFR